MANNFKSSQRDTEILSFFHSGNTENRPLCSLVFQSIGYYTQEIPVTASRTVYNVVLVEDTTMLEDVVVVGFGTQKKVNLTGSVSVATSEDIQARPVRNAADALQGLLPGLQLTSC